jgi:outer membrane murein-binding lipoprotein Lpp
MQAVSQIAGMRSRPAGPRWVLVGALLALACCGCASRHRIDVLETRLRQKEDALARLHGELATARNDLQVARRETAMLRNQLAGTGERVLLPEQADALFRVTAIEFSELLTGGVDQDGVAGDEQLSVVLIPYDANGELVKVPGTIELELFDPAKPEAVQRIGRWKFDTEESLTHWHRGFLGGGYLFHLAWQEPPQSPQLVLHGRLTTSDGRQFETSRPVRVTPPRREEPPGFARP